MSYTTADAEALPDGTVIDGRYRLSGRLGRGGFAWVYEARHTDLDRLAALKLLDPPRVPASASFRKRFMREAKIVARLSHPNVVTVYDFGVHESTEQPYLAMELLNGHDLEDELRASGPLDPARAQKLFLGAAEALRVAHEAGVIHKDLKPSNLFIADPGTPSERMVLLDFGIALTIDEESRITKVGAFTGTPAYVAPEYAKSIEVSPAVDIYQLGLILSESLSGVPCVEARSAVQMILAHCNGDIVLPDSVTQSVFGEVVLRATAFEPEDRYTNGGEFSAALATIDASSMPRASSMRRPGQAVTAQYVFEEARTDELEPPESEIDTLKDEPIDLEPEPEQEPQRPEPALTLDLPLELDRPAPVTTNATAIVARQDRRSELGWPWYVAGALGVAVIAAVGFLATRPQPPEARRTPQVVRPSSHANVTNDSDAGELAPLPRFTIASTPIGAVVFEGNERLGRTPVVLQGDDVDGGERKVRIELSGHETRRATIKVEDGGRLDVIMKAKRAHQVQIDRGQPSKRDKPHQGGITPTPQRMSADERKKRRQLLIHMPTPEGLQLAPQ